MKTILFSILFALLTLAGNSQSNEYYQAMGENLGRYANCKTVEDYQALGNTFNRIAAAEPGEWLPLYYSANCFIIMSFIEPGDAPKKDAWLDAAEKSLDQMLQMVPGEAEVNALQAMYYLARLVVNPMERGQKYSMLSAQAVGTALGIDPTNPRARFIQLQNNIGSARFYGKDPKDFCPEATALLNEWDNFKPKSPISPAWGKQQVAEIVNSCK